MDPSVAVLLSVYVAVKWIADARLHIQQLGTPYRAFFNFSYEFSLVGKTASLRFIRQLIYLTLRHDSRITYIADVKSVHFGENVMVLVASLH